MRRSKSHVSLGMRRATKKLILILTVILSMALGAPGALAAQENYQHWADLTNAWINGALQSSNSRYSENEVLPHYFKTSGLTVGNTYAFNIYYDYYNASTNTCGFDYLAQYNISRSPSPVGTAPTADTNPPMPEAPGNYFYTVGANITVATSPTTTGLQRYVTVVFQATATTAEFYWGLHLARDGAIGTCQGAAGWTGASLQTNVAATPTYPGATMIGGGGTLQINPSGLGQITIDGRKYDDLNGDGTWQQATEPLLQGWTIQLYLCTDGQACASRTLVQSDVTDLNGYYSFTNLTVGSWYQVCEVPQSGWTRTEPATSDCHAPLQATTTTAARNFGNWQPASITAHKFNDLNGNGVLDGGEPPLAGWTMTLYPGAGCTGTPINTGATDGSGNKLFASLPAGTYYVQETLQTGWTATTATCQTVTVSAGQAQTVNFGNRTVDLIATKTCPNFYSAPPFEFTITVKNSYLLNGQEAASPAPGVQFTDLLPAGLEYVSYSSDLGGTCSASLVSGRWNVVCSLPQSLAAAQTWTVKIRVTVSSSQPSQVSNSAIASAGLTEITTSNNTGSCATTTPVTLASFHARRSGDGVHIDWSTATEAGNVGFNLYLQTEEGLRRVNAELIPSGVIDSLEPQDYAFALPSIEGGVFFVEDVDIMGRTRLHGPFEVGRAYGSRVEAEPVDWAAIHAEHSTKAAARVAMGTAQSIQGQAAATQKNDANRGGRAGSPPAAGPVQLLVERDGLYRVSYEALLEAGFDLAGVKISDLALTNRGTPVSIDVQGNGPKFGPGAYLEFYGQALDTLYTRTNVYNLEVDKKLAQRVGFDSTAPDPGAQPAPFYMETVEVDNNRAYSFGAPSSQPWYDTQLTVYRTPGQWSFPLTVDNYVSDAASTSTVLVGLWGITGWPRSPDHHVVVQLNSQTVADEWFDGLVDHQVSVQLPAGLLHEGSNTLTLSMPADNGEDFDVVYLDRYGITYPRRFVATNEGRLTFAAAGSLFRVDGLPTPNAVVYRLDGSGLSRLAQVQVEGVAGPYSATFAGSGEPATYLVSTSEALLTPGMRAARPKVDITGGSADYVMIAHPDFVDGLGSLVAARQAQGYQVRLVDVEDIYAQFGYGIFDPQAIRDYIAHAANDMGAEYFLLVGGDTYDYHNYLGRGAISFVPSLYAQTSEVVSYAPVDPLYTDLDQDGVPDRPIGRFPVRTSAELAALITKTLAYGAKDYGKTAVFAADFGFTGDSESFVGQLPPDWTVQRAHADEAGIAPARATLIDRINAGVALTNFVGHSDWIGWSFDNLLLHTDVRALSNVGRPTVVTQYGCWNNWYLTSSYNTLAHSFLVYGQQGAAAVLGPTALAEAPAEAALGQLVTARLVEPGRTVGAAVQAAKVELAAGGSATPDVLLGWTLLGDPTLVVQP